MMKNIRFNQNILDYFHCDFLKHIDDQISKNVSAAAISTRPAKSCGLWCCLLLPTILLLYKVLYHVSEVYSLTTFVAIGILLNSMLFMIFAAVSSRVFVESLYGGSLACSFVSALLICTFTNQDIFTALIVAIPPICCLYPTLRVFLVNYSYTFTIGEAMIVVQSILLLFAMFICKLMLEDIHGKLDFNNTIVFVCWMALGAVVIILYTYPYEDRTLSNASVTLFGVGFVAFLLLHILLGFSFTLIFIHYILINNTRIKLVFFWLVLIVVTILTLVVTVNMDVKADTVMRKSFHLLASLVFASGIITDLEFLKLCAGLAFGLVMFVEALRKLNIDNVSPTLQSAFNAFCDEKDLGFFAVTPIYLLTGLACPLLLVPEQHPNSKLELMSGVLSIGIGDTAASWFGSMYGVNKWPGSERTVEGTTANVVSQVVLVSILKLLGVINSNWAIVRVMVAATVSSLAEATTEQIDNLILPLVTLIVLQLTSVLFFQQLG